MVKPPLLEHRPCGTWIKLFMGDGGECSEIGLDNEKLHWTSFYTLPSGISLLAKQVGCPITSQNCYGGVSDHADPGLSRALGCWIVSLFNSQRIPWQSNTYPGPT